MFWLDQGVVHRIVESLPSSVFIVFISLITAIPRIEHTGPVRTFADLLVHVPTRAESNADTEVATSALASKIEPKEGIVFRCGLES